MVHLTQLIYVIDGQEDVFDQFEAIAIPAIANYNGRLTLRIRPTPDTVIENSIEVPYEIHLAEFATQQDFEAFMADEARKQFLHLKEASIRSAIIIQGERLT